MGKAPQKTASGTVLLEHLPFEMDQGIAARASIGLIVMLTAAAAGVLQKIHPRAGLGAAAVVLLLFGGMSWQRAGYFTSEQALWNSVLERNPDAWMAHINLGLLHQREGRPKEAESHFESAIAIDHPEKDKAHYNLGQLYESTARLDRAMLLDPRNPDILDQHGQYLYWQAMNLADAGFERGELLEQAVAQYRQALTIRPLWPYTWANLVVAKAEWGIFDQEFRHAVRRTIETGPWEPRVQLQLIRVDFAEQNRIDRRSRERIDGMLQSAVLVQPEAVVNLALRWRQLPRVCPLIEEEKLLERCRRGGWQPPSA